MSAPGTRTIQLPLSISEWATLEAGFPLSETKWNQMLAVLTAMKPALVQADAQQPETPPAERPTLTSEARALLDKVDDGGVPAHMTGNLERIAKEHGVSVSPDMTPNQVIEELRQRG